MKKNNLGIYKIILVTLISSVAITGIGFVDDKIWEIVFVIVGMLAYSIVGLLYSYRFISGPQAGKQAYAAVFIIITVIGYIIYQKLLEFKLWLISWPLYVKIIVISSLIISVITTIIIMCVRIFKSKKNAESLENING